MKIFAGLVAGLLLALGAFEAAGLEAGAARVDITPPLGTPLNGYGDRMGRGAVAVHDPIWVRTLYLDDGQTRLFLVNADLCIINRELANRVLELAPDVVPAENIILTATHNHSGTGGMVRTLIFRFISGRFMPEILDYTAERFVKSMEDAYAARQRAAMGYGTFEQDDLTRNRAVDDGPIDEQVGVIRVEDADGAPIALVANLAAHPTSVPSVDGLSVSADYVGFYYDRLEELAPGCVAMFMNGAEGDQTCANPTEAEGWARTEAVGRLLAERVHEAALEVSCGAATLALQRSTPELPPTMAPFLPPTTTLMQLEINDLLVSFFPGEPCVELGLELRRRALERAYGAHFTVGLANDHLLYFVPRHYYDDPHYETAMNHYGPSIADWFYREFEALMTRGSPPAPVERPEPPPPEQVAGAQLFRLSGTAYAIGYQRGAALAEYIAQAYEESVLQPVDTGLWGPTEGVLAMTPDWLDPGPIALPLLGVGARPLLRGLSDAAFDEVEGLADGMGAPFDAAWLLQCAPTYASQDETDTLYESPFCTMFAIVGDRAGADDLFVGRNLDWDTPQTPVIIDARPEGGLRYVQVGFPWNVGVFTGMNAAGLVACVERAESLGTPVLDGPPIEMVVRDVLAGAEDVAAARAMLAAMPHLRGYRVLLADDAEPADEEDAPRALVMEFGDEVAVREPGDDGLLLGADPESPRLSEAARRRYGRVAELLDEERIVGGDDVARILGDARPDAADDGRIFNARTRHSVIFEPAAGRLRVAVPTDDGDLGAYQTIRLREAAP